MGLREQGNCERFSHILISVFRTPNLTLDEYSTKVASQLRAAHNKKDTAAVALVFRDSDDILDTKNITDTQNTDFWSSVYKRFRSGELLIEKQGNSALHALFRYVETQIKIREAGK
jgi:hypothetical protein